MNENYYSGDIGKCPFATAAYARELVNKQTSVNALKRFASLMFIDGPAMLVATTLALTALAAIVAIFVAACSGSPGSITIIFGG